MSKSVLNIVANYLLCATLIKKKKMEEKIIELREKFQKSNLSYYRVAKETGLSKNAVRNALKSDSEIMPNVKTIILIEKMFEKFV